MSQQQQQRKLPGAASHPLTLGGTTFAAVEFALMHTGPESLIFSLAAASVVVAGKKMLGSGEGEPVQVIEQSAPVAVEQSAPTQQPRVPHRRRSILDHMTGTYHDEPIASSSPQPVQGVLAQDAPAPVFTLPAPVISQHKEALIAPAASRAAAVQSALFSALLASGKFVPTTERIYIGTARDGRPIFSSVENLQHIAIAGKTGNGKSSIERLLMAQLCYVGASVLLLNPHYTRYDLKSGEDWTPIESFLKFDPMECVGSYEAIAHYLREVTQKLLPWRLNQRAHSKPWGDPIFIVIDELPSIVRRIPDAPEYLRTILEEGRKVGIYLISAAHDFLVRTISPKDGGGSIRGCYNLVYYLGGDMTTAQVLLNVDSRQVPENELGKGAVMVRCGTAPDAQTPIRASVPFLDNQALYMLLGPSTYDPHAEDERPHTMEDVIPVYVAASSMLPTRAAMPIALATSAARQTSTHYSQQHVQHLHETPAQRLARRRALVTSRQVETLPTRAAPASPKGVHSRIAKRRILSVQEDPFLLQVLQLYQDGITSKRAIAQKLTENGQPTSSDTANNALCDLEDLEEIPRRQRY
jgi:hypothetical protein